MMIISTLMVMLECFEYVNEGLSFYLFINKKRGRQCTDDENGRVGLLHLP